MILILFRLRFPLVLGLALGSSTAAAAQAPDREDTARRLADIASIAVAEYADGVVNGEVVRPEELAEARMFLEEARSSASALGRELAGPVDTILMKLAEGIAALRPEAELRLALDTLRSTLENGLGLSLDPFPATAPSLARGGALYRQLCVSCHGESGDGGPLASSLDPPPSDLSDRDGLRGTSVVDFFRKVNVGVAGTAMPAFADQLGNDDRWAVALYAATLRHGEIPAGARALLARSCGRCLLQTSDFTTTGGLSDDSLQALVAPGVEGELDDSTLAGLTAFARVAGAREHLGDDAAVRIARVVTQSKAMVDEAIAAAQTGERRRAEHLALDAYLVFEQIEKQVRARDARAAARVEAAFAGLRAAVARDEVGRHAEARAEVTTALDHAVARVGARVSNPVLFGQSLLIMLREGLEAILVIGALMAFLTKAGAPEQKRELGRGVLAALAASGLTALALATLFRTATAHQEALEGITMLVAAAVLFWVSYWLVSKIELRKWQEFVRTRMQRALSSKRSFALAAVAFLAVYREGFETVLFYAALFSTAGGALGSYSAIVAGIVLGSVCLGFVYFLMQRYGVRLPLKPFFAITSALLYVMAFSFAGQGVAELQAAGLMSLTPLEWLPSLPALGVFPTLQTAASQAVLALALAGALLWIFWLQPRTVRLRASL